MSDSVYEELAEKVKQFQDGDESAYDDLYRNGQRFVQAEVAKYLKDQDDINEVTQKVFISVYRSLNTLKNPMTFVDWIRTIARNESLAFLKSSYKKHNIEWSSLSQADEDGNENDYDPADENLSYQPQAVMDTDSKREILKGFLDALPDNQRLCVSMYFFDDLSIKEIAEELSFPENTVKSNLRYAKIKLKDQIEAYSKKHDIKLYSVSPFALLLYLFKTQEADLVQGYADTVSSDAVTDWPRGNTKSSSSKDVSKDSGNEPSATESAKKNAGKTSSAENRSGTGKIDAGTEPGSPDVNLGGSSAGTSAEPAAGTGAEIPSSAGPSSSGASSAGTSSAGAAATAAAGAAAAGGSAIVKIAIIGAVAAAAAGGTVIANRSRNDAGSSSAAESMEAPVSSEPSAAKTPENLYTFTYDSSIAAGSDIDPTQSVAGKVILRVDGYDADSGELTYTDYYHYNSMGFLSIKYYDSQSMDGYTTYQYTKDGTLTKEWDQWGDPVEPEYFFEIGAYSIHVDPHISTNPWVEVPMATAVNNETGEVIEPDPSTYHSYGYGEEINQVYDENGFLVSSEQVDYGSSSKKTYEYYSDGSLYRVIYQTGNSTIVEVYQYAAPEDANALFNASVPEDVKSLTEIYDPPIEPAMPMGVIRINADNLNIRTYPTTSSPNITQNLLGVKAHAMTGEVFPVYGIVEADGYTWYEIAESIFPGTEIERQAWVANQDNWITYYSALDN